MFSKPGSAQLSEKYVAVRIIGGDDLDAAGKAFMNTFALPQTYPSLLAMTPNAVVMQNHHFAGYFKQVMDEKGQPTIDRTLEGILKAMADAETYNANFVKREAELRDQRDPALMRELGQLYMQRSQLKLARNIYLNLTSSEKSELQDLVALDQIQAGLDDLPGRVAALTKLIAGFKDPDWNPYWQSELAIAKAGISLRTSNADEVKAVAAQICEVLKGLVSSVEGGPTAVGFVRYRLASMLAQAGRKKEALAEWKWIYENFPDRDWACDARWHLARHYWQNHEDVFTGEVLVGHLKAASRLLTEMTQKCPQHPNHMQARKLLESVNEKLPK